MIDGLSITGAFFTGLFGSVHCAAMCGGIVSGLSLSVRSVTHQSGLLAGKTKEETFTTHHVVTTALLYHGGRLISYMLAGFIASGIGILGYQQLPPSSSILTGQLVAAAFMLALGLYVSGIWQGLVYIEKLGAGLWKRVSPIAQKLVPIDRPGKAFFAGFLWGWLPCGMVYSVLVWSFSSGSLLTGTSMMLAFGLGTLPMLLGISLFSTGLNKILQSQLLRWISGSVLISFALWMIIAAISGGNQVHHH